MSNRPSVAIVVLNWNNYEDTADCVRSLLTQEYANYEILVVDNGSTDGSGERIRDEFDSVEVLFNEDNLGFSGGMNVGIRRALERSTDYVVLSNNDIVVNRNDAIARMVEHMEANPQVGVATPVIRRASDGEPWFERGVVDERSGRTEHVSIGDDERPVRNGYVPNCFAFVRGEVFERVGLLQERYFLYYEDVEFSIDVRDAGYEIRTVPEVTIDHEVSGSSEGGLGPTITYYRARNFLLLARSGRIDPSWAFPLLYLKWMIWRAVVVAYNLEFRSIRALLLGAVHGARGVEGRGPYP